MASRPVPLQPPPVLAPQQVNGGGGSHGPTTPSPTPLAPVVVAAPPPPMPPPPPAVPPPPPPAQQQQQQPAGPVYGGAIVRLSTLRQQQQQQGAGGPIYVPPPAAPPPTNYVPPAPVRQPPQPLLSAATSVESPAVLSSLPDLSLAQALTAANDTLAEFPTPQNSAADGTTSGWRRAGRGTRGADSGAAAAGAAVGRKRGRKSAGGGDEGAATERKSARGSRRASGGSGALELDANGQPFEARWSTGHRKRKQLHYRGKTYTGKAAHNLWVQIKALQNGGGGGGTNAGRSSGVAVFTAQSASQRVRTGVAALQKIGEAQPPTRIPQRELATIGQSTVPLPKKAPPAAPIILKSALRQPTATTGPLTNGGAALSTRRARREGDTSSTESSGIEDDGSNRDSSPLSSLDGFVVDDDDDESDETTGDDDSSDDPELWHEDDDEDAALQAILFESVSSGATVSTITPTSGVMAPPPPAPAPVPTTRPPPPPPPQPIAPGAAPLERKPSARDFNAVDVDAVDMIVVDDDDERSPPHPMQAFSASVSGSTAGNAPAAPRPQQVAFVKQPLLGARLQPPLQEPMFVDDSPRHAPQLAAATRTEDGQKLLIDEPAAMLPPLPPLPPPPPRTRTLPPAAGTVVLPRVLRSRPKLPREIERKVEKIDRQIARLTKKRTRLIREGETRLHQEALENADDQLNWAPAGGASLLPVNESMPLFPETQRYENIAQHRHNSTSHRFNLNRRTPQHRTHHRRAPFDESQPLFNRYADDDEGYIAGMETADVVGGKSFHGQ